MGSRTTTCRISARRSRILTRTSTPGFVQDTIRVTDRFALSLGVRYDLQTFTTKGLESNPLWPDAGKVPFDTNNFAPRVGLAYSIGNDRPLVIRAGYGLFYTRIPQIYTSDGRRATTGWREISSSSTTTIFTITRFSRNIPTRW